MFRYWPLYVADVTYGIYSSVKKFGYVIKRISPEEVPLVLSGRAKELCLVICQGKLDSSVAFFGNGKGRYKGFLVLLTDLSNKS